MTLEILQAELEKTKRMLIFHLARTSELKAEILQQEKMENKVRGRIELLNEQIEFLLKDDNVNEN